MSKFLILARLTSFSFKPEAKTCRRTTHRSTAMYRSAEVRIRFEAFEDSRTFAESRIRMATKSGNLRISQGILIECWNHQIFRRSNIRYRMFDFSNVESEAPNYSVFGIRVTTAAEGARAQSNVSVSFSSNWTRLHSWGQPENAFRNVIPVWPWDVQKNNR